MGRGKDCRMTFAERIEKLAETDGLIAKRANDNAVLVGSKNECGWVAVTVSGLERVRNCGEALEMLAQSRYNAAKNTLKANVAL